jgi:hypothetical protein
LRRRRLLSISVPCSRFFLPATEAQRAIFPISAGFDFQLKRAAGCRSLALGFGARSLVFFQSAAAILSVFPPRAVVPPPPGQFPFGVECARVGRSQIHPQARRLLSSCFSHNRAAERRGSLALRVCAAGRVLVLASVRLGFHFPSFLKSRRWFSGFSDGAWVLQVHRRPLLSSTLPPRAGSLFSCRVSFTRLVSVFTAQEQASSPPPVQRFAI